jgi:hypothetical protein
LISLLLQAVVAVVVQDSGTLDKALAVEVVALVVP